MESHDHNDNEFTNRMKLIIEFHKDYEKLKEIREGYIQHKNKIIEMLTNINNKIESIDNDIKENRDEIKNIHIDSIKELRDNDGEQHCKKRPPGRPPLNKRWCKYQGEYVPVSNQNKRRRTD